MTNTEAARQYRERYPERVRNASRRFHFKKAYGITLEDFDRLSALQDHRCAICGEIKALQVDHCHASEQVRKLLCHDCNLLVGWMEKLRSLIPKAIAYIEEHSHD